MPSECKTIAETLNNNTAVNADAIEYDVSDPVMFRKAIEDVKGRHGHLDIIFNHAEVNHVSTNDTGIFKDTMAANVQSVLECIKDAGDVMGGNKDGACVLCTSSNMVLLADVVPSAYSISQTALIGVIRAKAAELAGDGVRVNAISPASVDPRVLRSIFPTADQTQLNEMINNCKAKTANDDDVANAAVYLASDYGKSVTGQNLVLNNALYPKISLSS
ncbi:hypothetical protein BAE44_0019709 [Dichanthelium oligosanthes]|uniref:Uncharacterized protein n=1 Tax=Dichanthelium oligosanthes TaxID=888268 RepID=A0A1E5V287_9POAL|nr:hypothetical protein BAE44_0019709 [Dichanthelium oligosanthes]